MNDFLLYKFYCLFIKKIFFFFFLKAAQETKINYSTAKTILYIYRRNTKKNLEIKNQNFERCQFIDISFSNYNPVEIEISNGGQYQNTNFSNSFNQNFPPLNFF